MSPSPQKPRSIPQDSQPLPKGRIVTLGASARKRERFLLASLTTVSLALLVLIGTEAWMFQKGVLVFGKIPAPVALGEPVSTPIPVAAKAASIPAGSPVSGKPTLHKQHTQTVAATMAPTPASGKYEDIILPADKPATTESATKTAAPQTTTSMTAPKMAPAAASTTVTLVVSTPKPAMPKPPLSVADGSPVVASPSPPAAQAIPAAKTQNKPPVAEAASTPKPQPKVAQTVAVAATVATPAPATSVVTAPVVSARFSAVLEEAHADLSKGDFASALAVYDRILDQDSRNVAALTGKAYALQSTGQYDAALDLNRQLLKLSPNDPDIRARISALREAQKSH